MWCLSQFRAYTDIVTSACSTANTQITNFFISGTNTSILIIFRFLDSTAIFFLTEWKRIFLVAPSQDRKSFFSSPLDYFLFWTRSWRNAWRHQLGSRKEC